MLIPRAAWRNPIVRTRGGVVPLGGRCAQTRGETSCTVPNNVRRPLAHDTLQDLMLNCAQVRAMHYRQQATALRELAEKEIE
jgi:hypothetical protein